MNNSNNISNNNNNNNNNNMHQNADSKEPDEQILETSLQSEAESDSSQGDDQTTTTTSVRPSTVPTLSHARIPRNPRRGLPPIRRKKDSPQRDPKRCCRNNAHLTKQSRRYVSRRRHSSVTERCPKNKLIR